jgi:7,8-dihydropterin-6-yl-methyl-4-(beta-D-ribofuranosyl)aminobenzene 5'-phosphate synthase
MREEFYIKRMSCRITILCENTVGPLSGTLGEHGFSALVESDSGSLLFDTGQGETLLANARRMNRNLHEVVKVALSHGHYDHAGGLWSLLRTCGGKEIHAHPEVFRTRYRVKDTGEPLSIGMPYQREFLEGLGARFTFGDSWREIMPDIFLTGEIPRRNRFEKGDSGLFCDTAGCCADTHPDDQSLVIRTGKGLVLILGCCHAGIINTLEHVREASGVAEIHAVIGGMHLGFCDEEQIDETVKALRRFNIRKLVGSHCTGFNAAVRLSREFPGSFQPGHVGFSLDV